MSLLENKRDGRNVHVLIQVEDGTQYVVMDDFFILRNKNNCSHLRWFETKPDAAAARAMKKLSSAIRSTDYEIYNARALTEHPNYFAVWFATIEQFEMCAAAWTEVVLPVTKVYGLTPRKQKALERICMKAEKQHESRLQARVAA